MYAWPCLDSPLERIEQHIGVGEARVVPRHPLDEIAFGVRRGHAVRRLFRLHHLLAEGQVPIEDAVLDRLDIIPAACWPNNKTCTGLLRSNRSMRDGNAAGARLDLALRFKETRVAAVRDAGFLAVEAPGW